MINLPEIIEEFDFEEVDTSNNPVLRSWVRDGVRINWYFTSGTVMVQEADKKPIVIRDATTEQIEDIVDPPRRI